MKAFVLIKAQVGTLPQVLKRLEAVEGVLEVDGTFGPWDVVALVESDTLAHLGQIVFEELQTTAGVVETVTLPVVYG